MNNPGPLLDKLINELAGLMDFDPKSNSELRVAYSFAEILGQDPDGYIQTRRHLIEQRISAILTYAHHRLAEEALGHILQMTSFRLVDPISACGKALEIIYDNYANDGFFPFNSNAIVTNIIQFQVFHDLYDQLIVEDDNNEEQHIETTNPLLIEVIESPQPMLLAATS